MGLLVFKTPTCAYCKAVCTYLDRKGVPYELREAEGEEYKVLYKRFGWNVPLTYSPEKDRAVMGYDIRKLNELIS